MSSTLSFETRRIPVDGHEIATYSLGSGPNVVLLVHGGPGMACDYLRDSHAHLAEEGFRVVAYDQLGCGQSDRPVDDSLWVIDRYVAELETVRSMLGLGKIHLLGQSWGAFVGLEYALTLPSAVQSLILEGGAASIPLFASEQQRLRAALGPETVAMMERHETEGTFDHPEYKAAIEILSYRHSCRLQVWPDSLLSSLSDLHVASYHSIQGANEFVCDGNLKDWDRLDRLHELSMPALIMCGLHDVVTPRNAQMMHQHMMNSKLHVFQNSAHTPFMEEPEAYFRVLTSFLNNNVALAG